MKSKTEYGPVDALGTAKFFAQVDKFAEAKVALDLVKPYCQHPAQIDAIGKIYSDIREHQDCLELALKLSTMVTTTQGVFDVTSNIIRAYLNLNKPHEALQYIDLNLKRNPTDNPTLLDKAMALFLLNRKKEAEAILRQVLTETTDPDVANRIRFNLGTYDLANGDFQQGLRGFLLEGRKLDIWKKYDFPKHMQWEGGIQRGKTIMLSAEGGIGDEIINIRFTDHLFKAGMNPVWYTTKKDLAEVFRRNGFNVITDAKQYQSDWLWCYSMATPCYLNITEDHLWNGPYLTPKKAKEKLTKVYDDGPMIGFKCMGNPKYDQDLHRTIPYKEVLDSLPKNANIYSFHVDEEINDPRLISLKDRIKTWDDTLDYLDQMEVLVSSCTGLVHAASAMGKKTVVMVPILNYYVWAYPGKHSKWYSNNTTILRQTEHDNWNSPVKELHEYFSQG
jgi:hypothetical protein